MEKTPAADPSQRGFTLVETLIAMAIMLVAFSSILLVESGSISTTERAREMNIVSMLGKNAMIDAEFAIEGKSFSEVKKEEKGTFPEPYQNFSWSRVIKEVEFPNLKIGSAEGAKEGSETGVDASTEMMTKLVSQYLSKAIREVTVTISWQRGKGTLEQTFSTYWVDLNHEFQVTQ